MTSVVPVAASLVLVVALILGMGWVLRRVPGAARGGSALRVHAALPLGARERLLWVEAGGVHLLLGVTAQSINTLHRFDAAPATPPPASGAVFAERLRQMLAREPSP
jgi:flagellar protein FliO/FliZ